MRSFISTPNRKPMTEDEWRQAQMGFTQMPTDFGSGIGQVAQALALRKQRMGSFPAAPGGNTPGTVLNGLFRLGAKGGLY